MLLVAWKPRTGVYITVIFKMVEAWIPCEIKLEELSIQYAGATTTDFR